ncbi:MAG: zinc-dependent alcohol dehydrogenase family protein [Deltaproteobacteria bacterium]|nr:zinc-dependent alcohol dehydrogenase family protein [Deltaproteobacteria bacterium]MBW2138908.1 zinc-dependent alcohol dehydrogenase family protein [Deltaproteobacteria bacterium]
MKAMVLKEICEIETGSGERKRPDLPLKRNPLDLADIPVPEPGANQLLVSVDRCGICHTELDEIEGRLVPPEFPVVLGHEIIGRIVAMGPGANKFQIGDRVGIAWINSSCGQCPFCKRGDENLCDRFRATGLDAPGGYGQYTVVSQDFAYPIPTVFSDSQAAPLMCAGIIGYRALRLSGLTPGGVLGLFGFGASAHIAIQVARYWNCTVFVFTREGQTAHQELAKKLGAAWVGATGEAPPEKLDCAIDFTPVGEPVREALRVLKKGGRVTINAIRKISPIPELDYAQYLWHEREIKSVANVARRDALEFLPLAAEIGILPEVQEFELEHANQALVILKEGKMHGAGVLKIPR